VGSRKKIYYFVELLLLDIALFEYAPHSIVNVNKQLKRGSTRVFFYFDKTTEQVVSTTANVAVMPPSTTLMPPITIMMPVPPIPGKSVLMPMTYFVNVFRQVSLPVLWKMKAQPKPIIQHQLIIKRERNEENQSQIYLKFRFSFHDFVYWIVTFFQPRDIFLIILRFTSRLSSTQVIYLN
jgi:hypothetical protein